MQEDRTGDDDSETKGQDIANHENKDNVEDGKSAEQSEANGIKVRWSSPTRNELHEGVEQEHVCEPSAAKGIQARPDNQNSVHLKSHTA